MPGTITPPNDPARRTASIVSTLCGAVDDRIVLRFDGPILVPTSRYDGQTRTSDTIPFATINATVQHASVEDGGQTLYCFVAVDTDEIERLGIDPEFVFTEPIGGPPERWMIDIHASRDLVGATRAQTKPPQWDGLPTATTRVERTQNCHRRSIETNYHIQYAAPSHELGELIDVRVR